MNDIGIIGYGVLGKQTLNFLKEVLQIQKVIVFDDLSKENDNVDLVLPLKKYEEQDFRDFMFYIGIGYKHLAFRRELIVNLKKLKRNVPSFIHPSSYVSPYANIGESCFLFPRCNIDQNVKIGYGNILHNSVTISHDCIIGNCNYISPSVTICGNVQIGSETFVGAGTVISNNLQVGDRVRIGVGSCITQDIGPNISVIGNPQRILNKQLNIQ